MTTKMILTARRKSMIFANALMEKPYISILTPTYNRANLLARVFESLQRQTDKDFEWIIVDDGSTDNTEEIIKTFSPSTF
ncbi:glycosyltransferase family A protein, partial [Ornithobacterium rhinotracheale]|uniref:glycosyltransferase family 2 protein n=1 Tax=Ornithobacterium rhinotracheale TaxID=28251 RepID=UPI0038736E6B